MFLKVAGVGSATVEEVSHRVADRGGQRRHFGLVEFSGRASRRKAAAPECLVDDEVADARDSGLVEQASLEWAAASCKGGGEFVCRDGGCVGTEGGLVGCQLDRPEPAGVDDGELTVVEREGEPLVRGVRGGG